MPTHVGALSEVAYGTPATPPRDDVNIESPSEALSGVRVQSTFTPFTENHDGSVGASAAGILTTIHAVPEVIDGGHIETGLTGDQVFPLTIWNNDEVPVTLTGIVQIDPAGTLFVPPSLPLLITPETSYQYDVTILEIGDPVQDTILEFTFDNGDVLEINVVATREVFIPPEVPVPKNVIYIVPGEGRESFKLLSPDDLPLGTRSNPFYHAVDDVEFQLALNEAESRPPNEGEIYYNTTNHLYRYYDGTTFQNL